MSACSSVDLPEPVLPAISTCCDGALAELQVLQLASRRPGRAARRMPSRLSPVHQSLARRGDVLERHFDALGVLRRRGRRSCTMRRELLVRRAAIERRAETARSPASFQTNRLAVPDERDARAAPDLSSRNRGGSGCLHVDADQRVDAAAGAAGGDAGQPPGGRLGEVRPGNSRPPERETARPLRRRGRCTPRSISNSLRRYFWITFSMCSVRSASRCFDVLRLGPDAVGDELLVVVGQVHEAGEVLAQADRVDDREPHLARRNGREQPQHHRLHGSMARRRPSPVALNSSDAFCGNGNRAGRSNLPGTNPLNCSFAEMPPGTFAGRRGIDQIAGAAGAVGGCQVFHCGSDSKRERID